MHLVVNQQPVIEVVRVGLFYRVERRSNVVAVQGLPEESVLLEVLKDKPGESFHVTKLHIG